jgi:hypothetical protein
MRLTLLFALLVIAAPGNAQDVGKSDLSWIATQVSDLKASREDPVACTFRTRAGNSVEWIQKGGQAITTYSITSSIGRWTDLGKPGQVVYNVSDGRSSGTMTFERTASGFFVTLDFSAGGPHGIRMRFSITNVTAN